MNTLHFEIQYLFTFRTQNLYNKLIKLHFALKMQLLFTEALWTITIAECPTMFEENTWLLKNAGGSRLRKECCWLPVKVGSHDILSKIKPTFLRMSDHLQVNNQLNRTLDQNSCMLLKVITTIGYAHYMVCYLFTKLHKIYQIHESYGPLTIETYVNVFILHSRYIGNNFPMALIKNLKKKDFNIRITSSNWAYHRKFPKIGKFQC